MATVVLVDGRAYEFNIFPRKGQKTLYSFGFILVGYMRRESGNVTLISVTK